MKLAAVVQKMIQPSSSGILFTADPTSGHRDRIVIDAGFGLGEALVSGLINPDHYKLCKSNLSIISINIGDKKLEILSDRKGGTIKKELSESQRKAQVLSQEQIIELSRLSRDIENHYGTPQDIEWCFDRDQLYIVQSRPITSLYPVPRLIKEDNEFHAFISVGHIQVMTEAMKPMAHSIIHKIFPFGKKGYPGEDCPALASAGERLYLDITPLLLHPVVGKILPKRISSIEPLIGNSLQRLVRTESFKNIRNKSGRRVRFSSISKYLKPVIKQAFKVYFFLPTENRTKERFDTYNEWIGKIEKKVNSTPETAEKLLLIRDGMEEFLSILFTMFGYFIPGFIARSRIKKMVSGYGMEDEILALERGLKGNITTEMDLEMGDLADRIKEVPGLFDRLESTSDLSILLNELRADNQYRDFILEWDRFMELYGMRGVSEFDISRPRWRDNPSSIIALLEGMMQEESIGHHREQYNQLIQKAESAALRLCAVVNKGIFGTRKAKKMARLVSLVRNSLPLREHPKYFLIKIMGIAREELVSASALLKKSGKIDSEEDIWFLSFNEVIEAFQNPEKDFHSIIEQRKSDFKFNALKVPPRVITSLGEIIKPEIIGDFPEGSLPGAGVSAGIREGIARVILNPGVQVLKPGEILVAPFTDPAWTPLFINAAAVVIEVGGMMTHGSVIAREYGIPAVVSVEEATTKIQTGQNIRVNGDVGYVEIIEK